MRNLMIALLALLGALIAVEYNQYSHCKEWRLELGLRDQGIAPERSWSGAVVDFVAGDLITVSKKWQCGIQIERSEAVWSAIEAVAIVPAVGSAFLWVARTGFEVAAIGWHQVFAAFKLAVIIQQIYIRYVRGQTQDQRFQHYYRRVLGLADKAQGLAGL